VLENNPDKLNKPETENSSDSERCEEIENASEFGSILDNDIESDLEKKLSDTEYDTVAENNSLTENVPDKLSTEECE
jgi:hypothetical protein